MPRSVAPQSKKTGLPPGALVHGGEKRRKAVQVSILEYHPQGLRETKLPPPGSGYALPEAPTITWVQVRGIHEPDVLAQVGNCFGLHPLILEDVLNSEQRPKIEAYPEELFIVLKMLSFDSSNGEVQAEQVSLILRPRTVLSFQETSGDLLSPIQERLRAESSRLRHAGADLLVHAVLDLIVDHYFEVLEKIGDRIDAVEEKLVQHPSTEALQEIQRLKRNMILIRKWIWPLREVLSVLQMEGSPLVQPETKIYLRDVYDHTVQAIETAEIFREMLSGMIDIYLSSINNRLNAVMKVLTIIATIFMPLTFIAGVYGMNFKHMPELDWKWGYPLVLTAMAGIAIGMLIAFKRKKWL